MVAGCAPDSLTRLSAGLSQEQGIKPVEYKGAKRKADKDGEDDLFHGVCPGYGLQSGPGFARAVESIVPSLQACGFGKLFRFSLRVEVVSGLNRINAGLTVNNQFELEACGLASVEN